MSPNIRRPSAAMLVACLALLVALGGTSYATVLNVPKNSVGTPQLKRNAVTSPKVQNQSLLAVDFKLGELPAGPTGPQGPKGDQGDRGDAGVSGLELVTEQTARDPFGPKSARAACPRGKRVLGGGGWASYMDFQTETGPIAIRAAYPDGEGWRATAVETEPFGGLWRLTAYAICARVS